MAGEPDGSAVMVGSADSPGLACGASKVRDQKNKPIATRHKARTMNKSLFIIS